ADLAVVHRPRIQARPGVPSVPAVRAAIHAAVAPRGFDDRVNDARIGAKDVETDAPFIADGQAAGELRPGPAAVARAENPAARSAAVEAPRFPLPLIRGREQRVG